MGFYLIGFGLVLFGFFNHGPGLMPKYTLGQAQLT